MNITEREENGIAIVEIDGKMDTATSPAAQENFTTMINGGKTKILLNLAELDYLSSSGLRVILTLAKELEKVGGALRICNLNKVVQEIFDISGFSYILKVFPSESEALASF
jgi:anti-sigma B factor antagonist